ncbi:MAG: PAS domain S-box protein [Opitutae bacterium]|nr:PAS domain S-box protein [Opitutae bacterium]
MRVTPPNFRVLAAWLLIVVLGLCVAWWGAERRRSALLQQMVDRAQHCAVAFVAEDTAALSGTPADLNHPEYRAVKDRLMRLRGVSPGIRFVYLFRSTDRPGRVVFLADSEPETSPEMSKPGDDYPEAPNSPGLQAILRNYEPATEGPLRDSFGEWVTAYAPVGDRPPPGAPRTILGIDVDASSWQRELWTARLSAFGLVVLVLGVPLGGWLFRVRERNFNREIRRFSTAIQQSSSAVIITTPDRIIEYANDGLLAITGYQREELIGQPSRLLLPNDADEHQRDELLRRLHAGERWQGEMLMRRRNGEVFTVRLVVSPVRDGERGVTNLVAVFDDISDRKRVEDELRVARDQAEAADRAKGEFLAMMSHELRTPLNGIIGFATLLQDTSLTTEQSDYVETVRKSGEALLALTNELLDYSRIDAGRMQLDPQACAPRQIVEEAVELLSTRAADKHLELLVAVSPQVPAHVLADPGRLRQVLVNLIGNAIKFTPAGEVEVEVGAVPLPVAAGGDQRVRLDFAVRDTGIGIAVEKQDRLFQPFSQVDASTTRKHGGAGLGLAISRSLVRLMDGDIEVSSAAGAGSEFRFHIEVRVLEKTEGLPKLPSRRITVISANSRARAHYAALLEGWGLKVTSFENLTKLPAERAHDVLLIDVLARDASLWPALLEAHPGLADAPIIGLISVSVPAAVRDGLRTSFRALLKKPLRDPLFHAVLQSVLKA